MSLCYSDRRYKGVIELGFEKRIEPCFHGAYFIQAFILAINVVCGEIGVNFFSNKGDATE